MTVAFFSNNMSTMDESMATSSNGPTMVTSSTTSRSIGKMKQAPARVDSSISTDSSSATDPDAALATSFDDAGCARALPQDFAPSSTDVVLGRGKKCFGHVGNELLRLLVNATLDEYRLATSRSAKSVVILKVVNAVRSNSPNGGFVKQDPQSGRWFEVGDFLSREKTSQTFRDALAARYKSSKASKKRRRDGLADSNTSSASADSQIAGLVAGMLAAPVTSNNSMPPPPNINTTSSAGRLKTDPDDTELFDLLVRATDAWTMDEQQLQHVYQGGYGGSTGAAANPFEPTPLPEPTSMAAAMSNSASSSFSELDNVPDMDDFGLDNANTNNNVQYLDAAAVFRANGWTALIDPEEFTRRSKAVKMEHGWNTNGSPANDNGAANHQPDTNDQRKANQEYLFKQTPRHKSRAAVMA